jgi:hypothetical protein
MLYKWGWGFGLNRIPDAKIWLFSAKLYPFGRSSIDKDWERLGRVVQYVYNATGPTGEAPEPDTPMKTTPPNATHYWTWKCPVELTLVPDSPEVEGT